MSTTQFGPGRQYQLDVDAAISQRDIAGNRTLIYARIYVRKLSGTGYRTSNPQPWRFIVNGVQIGAGTWTYNFAERSEVLLWEGTWWHNHNSDGTATPQGYTGYVTMDGAGEGATGGTITPEQIPRTSSARFRNNDGWFTPGTQVPIDISRASSSFTHDITWAFGVKTGTVATGVGTSYTWTPPLDLLTEIPNAPYGRGHITVTTKNGGSVIGSVRVDMWVSATDAKPTVTSIAVSDDNPNVASIVGLYVQGMSLLKATVDATSTYGATVPTRAFSVDGKTVPVGGTIPLDVAGTRTVTATVTDSRQQSASSTGQITVLPYAPPDITSMQVRRATAAGAPAEEGTYLRVDLEAIVASLVNGTQRNALTIRVFTRQGGTSTWIARNVVNAAGLTYSSNFIVSGGGIFDIARSFDVRVDLSDKFGVTQRIANVSTSPVLMHFDADIGVGIGKRRDKGMLDVAGPIYQAGQKVIDEASVQTTISDRFLGASSRSSSSLTASSATFVSTGLSLTVSVPAGSTVRFTIALNTYSGSVSDVVGIVLREGSTDLLSWNRPANSSPTIVGTSMTHTVVATLLNVGAGARTYTVGFMRAAGNGTITAVFSATQPGFFTAERL